MKINVRSLAFKLVSFFFIVSMIPAAYLTWQGFKGLDGAEEATAKQFQLVAEATMDKIERNLFERYGDVQAFATNELLQDERVWRIKEAEYEDMRYGTTNIINNYVTLYGIYYLSIITDLEGNVIGVNDMDAQGNRLDTEWLYEENFKDSPWFKAVLSGEFLKSESLDGTYVEDLHVDPVVAKVYGNEGYVISYSAPVKNNAGEVIGVWTNRAAWGLVEDIVKESYLSLKAQGMPSAELTLLDSEGRVTVDFDPMTNGGKLDVVRNGNIIQKLNLAQKGVAVAERVVNGQSGSMTSFHARKKIWQSSGYAASKGAMGYPGLNWGMLVRVDVADASREIIAAKRSAWIALGSSGVFIIALALFMARRITKPILSSIAVSRANALKTESTSKEISEASNILAEGSCEQAASVEETSASLEEIEGSTKMCSENAQEAASFASQAQDSARRGNESMQDMMKSMDEIKRSSDEVSQVIKTIDEIAFQTNILSLNASVEAARAGEAGAGFAVVAEEVRNLASRSAEAAKNTAELIESSTRKSTEGFEVCKRVQEDLTKIVEVVARLTTLVNEVDVSAQEQRQGVLQINEAMSQIDKVTQQSATGAQETARYAQDLDSQAKALKDAIESVYQVINGR